MSHPDKSDFELRNLSVGLGGRQILKDVSLEISAGKVVCVMGPSGCGKTTLLRAIARLQPAESGQLRLGKQSYSLAGNPPERCDGAFYPRLSYVPQTLALWPHFSNYENITFAMKGSAGAQSAVIDLARELRVEDILHQWPDRCSHGQRQRAALIRALILRPRYLLLDEVTSALDRINSERVAAVLRDFVCHDAIVLAITHDIRFAQAVANKVFEMDFSGNLSLVPEAFHDRA